VSDHPNSESKEPTSQAGSQPESQDETISDGMICLTIDGHEIEVPPRHDDYQSS
jgi:hypothetical protein